MKKCPTCDKTFDDAMKFCQTDGTPLVEFAENTPDDPYKTMVAGKEDLSSAIPPPPDMFKTMVASPPIKIDEDEVLEIPEKPAILHEAESSRQNLSKEKDAGEINKPLADVPLPSPFGGSSSQDEINMGSEDNSGSFSSEPPDFGSEAPPRPNSFDDFSKPKDSMMSDKTSVMNTGSSFDSSPLELDSMPLPDKPYSSSPPFENPSTPPISSPFDPPMPFDQPTSPGYQPPPVPEFKEEEIKSEAFNTPFAEEVRQEPPAYRQSEWTPPPAPVASWQNQEVGQNTPFQPPVAGGQGQNQTLAVVSLVCGIASLLCCTTLLPGIAAVVTGFIARKNVSENPNEYGGSGMALAGIITGGISVLFGLILLVLYIFTGVLAGIGNM